MLTLVLTRHGETVRSHPEQHLGQRLDVPLDAAGEASARRLGERLRGIAFERVVASPLQRAQATARIAAPGAAIETDARLSEMDYGSWEGLTYEQITARDGTARSIWEADPASLACPGGESGRDVARRIRRFLEDAIARATDGGPDRDCLVLAVGHSTTNRVLLSIALGVPLVDFRRRWEQDPVNLTVLRFGGPFGSGAQALLVNDVGHLRGLTGATWG